MHFDRDRDGEEYFLEFSTDIGPEMTEKEVFSIAENTDSKYNMWYLNALLELLRGGDRLGIQQDITDERVVLEEISFYEENEPGSVEIAADLLGGAYPNLTAEKSELETYFGAVTVHSLGDVWLNRLSVPEATNIVSKIQSRFPEGVQVRVSFRQCTKEEKEIFGFEYNALRRTVFLFVSPTEQL